MSDFAKDTNVPINDCISFRAAINAIRMLQTYKLSESDEMLLVDIAEVQTALTMLPSTESRWIPVTERLPDDGAEVWVTTDMLFEVTRARWHKDSNLWCHPYYSDCLLVLRPIAWMEMSFPEPYKGGVE